MPKSSTKSHLGLKLANPSWLFWLLPWYGVVLIAGTVAQKFVGLYQSQKAIFNAIIWWAGPIPLLGGAGVLLVLALGLAAKLIWRSPWRWGRLGINLIHIGALALLLAGALTATQQEEGYIVIKEGQQSNKVEDYHQREIVITTAGGLEIRQNFEQTKPGDIMTDPALPYKFIVLSKCLNCQLIKQKDDLILVESEPALQQENSNYGMTFQVVNLGDGKTMTWRAYEHSDNIPQLRLNGNARDLTQFAYVKIQKAQRALPFALKLDRFTEDLYPGSEIAKEYQSNLQIIDKGVAWPARVAMNEPLQHGGYTFFQSSFERYPDGTTATVLSVVHNQARWGLYLAAMFIIGGLLIYLGQHYVKTL